MATRTLEILARKTESSILKAIADAFTVPGTLFPDNYTKRLLNLTIKHPKIIEVSNEYSLINHLKKLVNFEPEKVYKICDIFVNMTGGAIGDISTRFSMVSDELINIALTLQRNANLRDKGLNLFERLLELDALHVKDVLSELDRRPVNLKG